MVNWPPGFSLRFSQAGCLHRPRSHKVPTVLDLTQVTIPTLLLDEARARANLRRMAARARSAGATFRPHFKTHQSSAVGEWFREEGVTAITVSSLRMAGYFAAAGWDDITVAFPANLREAESITRLASTVRLGLIADSVEAVDALGRAVDAPLRLWIEVDAGYMRSGVPTDAEARLLAVAGAVRKWPNLELAGLLTHAGDSYGAQGVDALQAVHERTLAGLHRARATLAAAGHEGLLLSIGDTPCCSVLDDLGDIDEMRPGNFIFYDWMQHEIGACTEEQIAVAVACPVVALYPERNEVALYGGAVHLSKEALRREDGSAEFGRVAPLAAGGWGTAWADVWVRSLSQEHGMVRCAPGRWDATLGSLRVGDLVAVLLHSCLTADLLKGYLTLDGQRLDMMRPW